MKNVKKSTKSKSVHGFMVKCIRIKTVCDNCYFKFAGTLETIKDLATLEEIDAKYKYVIGVVN